MRFAGVNLRLSSPSTVESHTTAFHRDYNSYYTVKLFIPLSEHKRPFLEYFPTTELISTGSLHYAPKHINECDLPKRIRKAKRDYSSTNIQDLRLIPTNCIHREKPYFESKITLIITYSSHQFKNSLIRVRKADLDKTLTNQWAKMHLGFINDVLQ